MATKRPQHFVLVHGAFHGAWCWIKLVSVLERAGHRVTAVDLLGSGENRDAAAEDITSGEQYDTPLTTLFETWPDDEKVILVGHSMGGMTISRMSEKFPKKICLAIYLASFMPGISKENPKIMNEIGFEIFRNFDFENPSSLQKSHILAPEIARELYYNKSSLEDCIYARDRLTPYAPICAIPPSNLTIENYGSVPKVFILAHDDKAILPKEARQMVKINPPDEFFEIDGDHSPFFSNLESLEKIFENAAVKYGSS